MDKIQEDINKYLSELNDGNTELWRREQLYRLIAECYNFLAAELHKKRFKSIVIDMPESAIHDMEMDIEEEHYREEGYEYL